jgi:hypothetical protein
MRRVTKQKDRVETVARTPVDLILAREALCTAAKSYTFAVQDIFSSIRDGYAAGAFEVQGRAIDIGVEALESAARDFASASRADTVLQTRRRARRKT